MNSSSYKHIGLGIATADKVDENNLLHLYLPELLPFHEGDINDKHTTTTRTIKNADGKEETINMQVSCGIVAEWIGEEHRVTAPDIVKSEQVDVFMLEGSGKYYWSSNGRDSRARRTEAVVKHYSASGKPAEEDINQDDTNRWVTTVDTKNGIFGLSTSKDNGEFTNYDIHLHAKDGIFDFKDGTGMAFQLDSKNKKVFATLPDGTSILLSVGLLSFLAKLAKFSEDVQIVGDLEVGGNVTVDGEVKCKNIVAEAGTIKSLNVNVLSGVAIGNYRKG